MKRKRVLALCVLVALVALAGCSSILGPDSVDSEALARNETYEWETGVNASFNVTGGEYEAVYDVTNTTTFPVHSRDTLGRERPLAISSLQFRYPNGTVVDVTTPGLSATNQQERTVISLPARNGKLAFSAPANGKRFATRTFVTGSYEATIPRGMRVDYFPLARVSPSPSTVERTPNGRVHISWNDVEANAVIVRYYLERDLYLFAAGAALLVVVALAGALYYLRQIRELERRRRDAGPDIDTGDGDNGPGL